MSASPSRFHRRLNRGQRLPLDHQARQSAGRKCPGIDIDAVWADLDVAGGGMAVHDDLAEVAARREKLSPYPEQIALLLARQIDVRLNPGMSEEEIAQRERDVQEAEKAKMSRWQGVGK